MEQLGGGAIFADGKVQSPITVVVGISSTTLLPIDDQTRPCAVDRLQLARAVAEQEETPAGVEPGDGDRCREEVLAQKDVFLAVTIEVRNAGVKRRRQLRLGRQRVCLEVVTAIQEHHVMERAGAQPYGFVRASPGHIIAAGM